MNSYLQALHFKPDTAETHCNLGAILHLQGNPTAAVACFQQALRFRPNYAEARHNLRQALATIVSLTEPIDGHPQTLRLKPDCAEAYCGLGAALLEQGMQREAVAYFEQALRLKPNYAHAHNNLGVALAELGRLNDALACCRQALRHDPDYAKAHVTLAYFSFLQGNFTEGWPEHEWRWKRRDLSLPVFKQPRWDGSSLQDQTILLFAEQGLGDTLQFVRYAPIVKQTGATVLVQCPGPLHRLLATCAGIDCLVAEGGEPPGFQVQSSLLSLPWVFGTTLATIPAHPLSVGRPRLAHSMAATIGSYRGFQGGYRVAGKPATRT